MRTLIGKTTALPQPLWDWIEAESSRLGMKRGPFLIFLLSMHRQNGSDGDLRRKVEDLTARVERLEK